MVASELENWLTLKLEPLAGLSVQNIDLVLADGSLTQEGWGALAGLFSAMFCFAMYMSSRFVTPLFIKCYRDLGNTEQRIWDARYPSNVHAVACVFFGYEMLLRSDFFWKEGTTPMVLRTSPATYIALGTSFGYFVIDFVTCIKYNMGGTEMVLHHFGALLSVTTALVTGNGHMHTLWMLVTEFTTPLINNRWWLDKMGLKTHRLYIINGLAIVICWIFARLAVFPPFFWILWKTQDQIQYITPLSTFLIIAVPIILITLNCFWFYKIVKGAIKVFFGPKGKDKAE